MTTENFARPILSLMSTGKGYPLSTNEFIRDWLAREWFARGRTAADLARELKLTEATVSNFRNRKRGAGYEMVTGCARLMGLTRDELEARASKWQEKHMETDRLEPYPNRAAALKFLGSDVPADVIARVRAINLDVPGDPSKAWWVSRIASEIDVTRSGR